MKSSLAVLSIALVATVAAYAGDDHASCPLHAEHMKNAGHEAMIERGDEVMGFAASKTTHHFRLLRNGGTIEVNANSAADSVSIGQIRKHLALVASEFAGGDFSMPEKTHDVAPPGVEAMARLRSNIRYSYEETETGGRVRLATDDSAAVSAIHDFLKFQIEEHQTGDPLVPRSR